MYLKKKFVPCCFLLRPTERATLLRIEGASFQWVDRFGMKLLQKVQKFIKDNPKLQPGLTSEDTDSAPLAKGPLKVPLLAY